MRSLSLQACSPDPKRKHAKKRWSGSLREGGCRLEQDPASPPLAGWGTRREVRNTQGYPQKPPRPAEALPRAHGSRGDAVSTNRAVGPGMLHGARKTR